MIVVNVLVLVAGFIALIKGADRFVDGSSALAKTFHVPGLIIGLTIVALGTSAPELAVSTMAAIQGSNEIAISNVVGSNIFNLLCVLGICALIYPVPLEKGIAQRDFPVIIAVTIFVLVGVSFNMLFLGGQISINMHEVAGVVGRPLSIVLLAVFVCYIAYLIIDAKRHPAEDEDIEIQPLWKSFLLILVGIVLIVAGGQAVVYAAKEIARTFGMTETLIGLTIVAVGTSLPELVTSIVAAKKGETGMAVGNVAGSNIFNMMFILGVSSMIHPVGVNVASLCDMLILLAASIVVYVFSLTRRTIERKEGVVMLLIYISDMAFAIMR